MASGHMPSATEMTAFWRSTLLRAMSRLAALSCLPLCSTALNADLINGKQFARWQEPKKASAVHCALSTISMLAMPITLTAVLLAHSYLSIFSSRQLFGLISVLHQLFYYYCTNSTATVQWHRDRLWYGERLAFVSLTPCSEGEKEQLSWKKWVPAAWWCPSTVNASLPYGPLYGTPFDYLRRAVALPRETLGNWRVDEEQGSTDWNESAFDASS